MRLSLSKRLQLFFFSVLGAWVMRLLACTWSVRELAPQNRSPKCVSDDERYIYAYWHEYIIPTVGYYRGHPIHALASRSFDGDIISAAMGRLGYPPPARGSSSQGGAAGLRELLRRLQEGNHVAITVDGPRGPRRVAQDGVLKLAQLSGKMIVPLGYASSSVWRFRSWDRSLVPLPFSLGVFCLGAPIAVPRDAHLDPQALQHLQAALDKVTHRAELSLKQRQDGQAGDVENPDNPQF